MKANVKSILFFLFLILVIVIGAVVVSENAKTQDKFTYGDLQELFDYGLVKSFEMDNKNYLKVVAYEATRTSDGVIVCKALKKDGTQVDYDPINTPVEDLRTYSDGSPILLAEPKKGTDGAYVTKNYTYRISLNTQIEYISERAQVQKSLGLIDSYNFAEPVDTPWFLTYLPYIVIFGGIIFLYIFMYRQTSGKGGPMNNFAKAHTKSLSSEKNPVRFADVAGADEEKAELEEVVEFLRDPQKYIRLGARIPRGVLLVGPPGTGKTLLAKAVAGEAGVPFYSISGSDFVEMYVGVGASRVRDLFATARRSPASIIFIDEIDAVGRHRGAGLGGGHDEREQTLNQLLVEMDGFGNQEGVIVLAATNRPDILDPALLRPGRFDRQVTVNYPDLRGREEILKVHVRNKPLEANVDLHKVAMTTVGFTGADLANLMNEAALLAASRGKELIGMPEIDAATLKVLGDGAFIGCNGLVTVDFSRVTGLRGRGDEDANGKYFNYLFAYCTKLETVLLPADMKRIGKYAFAGCESLKYITGSLRNAGIGDIDALTKSGGRNNDIGTVAEVDDYAFTSCAALPFVNLSQVESIGFGTFAKTALTGRISAPYLVSVGDYAFQNTNLLSFEAPKLERIGEAAFQDNALLSGFTFSRDLREVKPMAFLGCTSLAFFTFAVDDGNASSGVINDYARLFDGVLYTTLPSGDLQLHSVPAGMFKLNGTKQELVLEVAEGTTRIDLYAGNENPYLTKLILPSTLASIGNYAFYGCDNLTAVEFRSYAAPALESNYAKSASLDEKDPGYELLHNQFDLFDLELCYYHFIDLVGKKTPISMTLPKNPDAKGYDALVYLVYFGAVKDARRSDYEAMDENMKTFIEDAQKIMEITKVTLYDETLINRAVSALNAAKQDPKLFGYNDEEWKTMTDAVKKAKGELSALKLARAGKALQDLQARINALPDTYTAALRDEMAGLETELASLSAANRNLLNLTRYNALRGAYEADKGGNVTPPDDPTNPGDKNDGKGLPGYAVALIVVGALVVAAAAACPFVIKAVRRKNGTAGHETPETKNDTKEDEE